MADQASRRQRRRRRRRVRRLAPWAVALVLLLWLGSSGGGGRPGEKGADGSARPADGRAEMAVRPPLPAPEPSTTGLPEPGGEPEKAELEDAAVADRLWGCLRQIEDARDGAGFVAAARAVSAADALPLDPAQSARLVAATSRLEQRFDAFVREWIDREAREGRVVDAAARLRELIADDGWVRDRATALLVGESGWPDWRVGPGSDLTLAADATLPRGTRVRLMQDGERIDGVVVASRAMEVTVRVRTPAGDRFPTVEQHELEPIGADPEVALRQAAVARRVGAPLLAAAWEVRSLGLGR